MNRESLCREHHRGEALPLAFGADWKEIVTQRFGGQVKKWGNIAKSRGGQDFLDGMQFGDLVRLVRAIKEVTFHLSNPDKVDLAFTIILDARPEIIHPVKVIKKDLTKDEFERISLAADVVINGTRKLAKRKKVE